MSGSPQPVAFGLVRTALAPVYADPRLPAALISQAVLGARVDVLERNGAWLSIRCEDGYVGWMPDGYLRLGTRDWATAWERGEGGEPVLALGAELDDPGGRTIVRLPWGARLFRRDGACHLPDGRYGRVAGGDVIDASERAERFPPRGESIVRTALHWLGAPYLWGGVTPCGVDCSGLAQAVLWLHGIQLPRDSDLQAGTGRLLAGDEMPAHAQPGDLLFFADRGERVTHVAISAGGRNIIHSALGNGGVAVNDLEGGLEFERRLRALLVHGRRLLPG